MGLLESFEKIARTAERVTNTTDRTINTAERAKQTMDRVGEALAQKCKYCKAPLKSDAEKKKGICANCALQRFDSDSAAKNSAGGSPSGKGAAPGSADPVNVNFSGSRTAVFSGKPRAKSGENPLERIFPELKNLPGRSLPKKTQPTGATIKNIVDSERITLNSLQESDISALSNFTKVKDLSLHGSQNISDFSPLGTLANLESLYLSATNISDLSVLVGLKNLKDLDIEDTNVTDLSPLRNVKSLERLSIRHKPEFIDMQKDIEKGFWDLSPLFDLPNLKELAASEEDDLVDPRQRRILKKKGVKVTECKLGW